MGASVLDRTRLSNFVNRSLLEMIIFSERLTRKLWAYCFFLVSIRRLAIGWQNERLAKRKRRNAVMWAILSLAFPIFAPLALLIFVRHKWRTLDEYLALYPNCRTGQGFSCAFCGSRSIRAVGVNGPTDGNKLHMCNHCGAGLYET